MKINKKLLIAILLGSVISYIPGNIVGMDQQQEYMQENDQQKKNSGLQIIRDEILKYNFTGIDPNVFVMTIARAKIGSLTSAFNKDKQFVNLLSDFQKAIIDTPKIDSITCNSSKSDINTFNDQINNTHLSIGYGCIKDTLNIISGREYGELKNIADLDIALRLFRDSFVELIDKEIYEGSAVGKAIGALEDSCSKMKAQKEKEYQSNKLIGMLQDQKKNAAEFSKNLKELHKNDSITVFGDDHHTVLNSLEELEKVLCGMISGIEQQHPEVSGNELPSAIKILQEEIKVIQDMCKTHKQKFDTSEKNENTEQLTNTYPKSYAMLCRISTTMSYHAKSLQQFKSAFLMKYLA